MTCEQMSAGWRGKVYSFLISPAYILLLTVLTAISFVLGGELFLYTVFALIVVFTVFCAPDVLPLMPLLAFGYVATSPTNNPGRNPDSVFAGATGLYIIGLGAVMVICLVYMFIRDRKKLFRKNGQLLWGLVILTVAYCLSGIGFPGYKDLAWKNVPYALVQGVALLLPYWLITGGVEWERHRKDFFAWMGVGLACLLVVETLWIYISQDVLVAGEINRDNIYTGWGMYNNLGGMLAAMIPFSFWLALYYKKHMVGYLLGAFFLLGVLMTCSRSSLLCGAACFGVCCLLLPARNGSFRKWCVILLLVAVAGLMIILFHEQIYHTFHQLLDGQNVYSRVDIYGQGMREFAKNPIFGGSFYPAEGLSYSWAETAITTLLPARWHNTIVQLLAATGLVGLLAYAFHRYQTVRLVLQRKNRQDMLILLSVLVILAGSLVDCHMFNAGPGMFYGMAFAWIEKKSAM